MPPIRKGYCYRDAFRLLLALDRDGENDWRLCHGVMIGTGQINQGKPCGHAWLESVRLPMVVLDAGGHQAFKHHYYRMGRIDPAKIRRYTTKAAKALHLQTGRYGPWNREIWKAEEWIGDIPPRRKPCGASSSTR